MLSRWVGMVGVVASAAMASRATAGNTLVTFADPSLTAAQPMFAFNAAGVGLQGGWSGPGLLLQTPGIPGPDYPNATFEMAPLHVTGSFADSYILSAGSINFFDQSHNPLITFSFHNATISFGFAFGASDFRANTVSVTGPLVSQMGGLFNQSFGFVFANQIGSPSNFTATAAFTSSASVDPSPGSASLLVLGGVTAARRRRGG